MLKYNKDENILYAFTHECAIPKIPERCDSENWVSLDKYLFGSEGNTIRKDLEEIFLPALQDIVGESGYMLGIEDIKIEQPSSENYFNDTDWKVRVKFSHPSVNSLDTTNCQYLTVMSIPYMQKDGVIEREGKKYAFVKTLEQCPGLSWEERSTVEKSVKLRLDKGYVTIAFNSTGPNIILSTIKYGTSNTKFSLFRTIFSMAQMERFSPREIWNEFCNPDILEYYRKYDKLKEDTMLTFSNTAHIQNSDYINDVVPRLRGEHFTDDGMLSRSNLSTAAIRDELNEVLSFRKVISKKLAEDVVSPLTGNVVAKRGDVITDEMVDLFEGTGVYRITIERKPVIENMKLVDPIHIHHLARGVKVTPAIIEILTNLEGVPEEVLAECNHMYISKDYYLEIPIVLWNGDVLTPELIELIMKSGEYKSISITEKDVRDENYLELYFMDEVITNRQFPTAKLIANGILDAADIVDWENQKWAYLDASNTLCPITDYFTTYDLVALASFTAKLFAGEHLNVITNSDEGFRKRVLLPSEQYRNAFRAAVEKGLPVHRRALKNLWMQGKFFISDEASNKYLQCTKQFWEYLRDTAKCVRLITSDAITNPLSYLAATTRIETFHKSKHSIADSQRRIAIGSFSRVDAYEIPQSASMGVVLNRAVGCNVALDGTLTVDYRRIETRDNGELYLTNKIDSLTVKEEEQYRIADIQSIKIDPLTNRILNPDEMVLARVPSTNTVEKQTFLWVKVSQVQYVNVHALQPLSWTVATMPFLSSNEAARIVFGAAQLKQAKGLINAEKPRVMTSAYKIIPTLNDLYGVVAKRAGYVYQIMRPDIEKIRKKDKSQYKNSVIVTVVYTDKDFEDITAEDLLENAEDFTFKEFEDSHYSVTVRKCNYRVGDRFEVGDTIIGSNWVQDGILTLGVNALVGYRPDGYNYEDGVHESMALGYRLTSYKINKEEFFDRVAKKMVNSYDVYKKRTSRWISPDDVNYLKPAFVLQKTMKTGVCFRKPCYPEKARGFIESVEVNVEKSKNVTTYKSVTLSLCSVDPYGKSDKMANRHGNKGVAPIAEETSNMPRLLNGIPLDISYNSAGVISRMNMGQVLECHAGLAALVLDIYICTDSYNRITFDEIKMLLKYAHDLANSPAGSDPRAVCYQPEFATIPEELHDHACANIDKIRLWAGCFDEKGEAYLIDPKHGNKLTETKVLIGVNYVVKLIQEGESKNHARGGMMLDEPYQRLHGAPTHGSSESGGQRSGTMELDAYCAYGCSKVIEEMINERGDNPVARNNLVVDTYLDPSLHKEYKMKGRGQRRSVSRFLYTLLSLGVHTAPSDGEFYELSSENSEELKYYTEKAIKEAGSYNPEMENKGKRNNKKNNDFASAAAALTGSEEMSYDDSKDALDSVIAD